MSFNNQGLHKRPWRKTCCLLHGPILLVLFESSSAYLFIRQEDWWSLFFLFYAEVEFPCKIPAEPVSWFFRACDLSLQLLVLGKRFHPSNTTRHDGSLPSRDEVDDAGRGIFSLVLCSTRAQIIMREVKNFPANSLRYLYIMQIASSTILRNWRKEKSRGIATWRCILRSRNSFEDNCWLPPLYLFITSNCYFLMGSHWNSFLSLNLKFVLYNWDDEKFKFELTKFSSIRNLLPCKFQSTSTLEKHERLGHTVKVVIMEMSPVSHVDATAMHVLKEMMEDFVETRGLRFMIANPNPQVMRSLQHEFREICCSTPATLAWPRRAPSNIERLPDSTDCEIKSSVLHLYLDILHRGEETLKQTQSEKLLAR